MYMKKTFLPDFSVVILILLFVSLLAACFVSKSETQNELVKKKAVEWYNSYEWLNGLKLTPHTSIDKEEFAKEYQAHKIWWDKAFAFIKKTNLARLKPGDYQIEGEDVYARVTEVPLKNFDSSKWEAHKNYHDIHYMITGKEKIGIGSLSSAALEVPYDSKRDIAFYNGKGSYYIADTSTFFIAFTKHIHRPGLEVNGKEVVKKLVIKVRSSNSN